MEWEIVNVLYREMTYKRLKANPQLSADWKKFLKTFKRSGSLKRTLLSQALLFSFLGLILFPGVYYVKTDGSAVIYASYCMLPLIVTLYGTAVTAQYAVSLGLFEPLLSLPVRVGGKYLSALLLITELPSTLFLLPPTVALSLKLGITAGILGLAWALIGAMLGHTLGLVIYDRLGKASGGRFSGLKTAFKAFGIVLVMSLFYGLNYLQRYVASHYETLKGVFERYSIAYPFSVVTVEKPLLSLGLLIVYGLVIGVVYVSTVRRLWRRISEGTATEKRGSRKKLSPRSPALALALKDFKIASRNTSLLTGLLMPVVMIIPALAGVLSSGGESSAVDFAFGFVLAIGWTSFISIDAVLKIDGRGFEVLHSLPLSLGTFRRGKLITMTVVPVTAGLGAVLGLSLRNPTVVKVLPLALLLPVATAGTTLTVFYWGIKEVALPQTTWKKMLLALLANGLIIGATFGLWHLGWFLSIPFLVIVDALLLWHLSR
ncbi:membrane protein [Thermococcus guaymasensis DSM 11113]|uniref:Membrane protein n=1 Tax=Thermococcus guaymasensis DSM 11113 TaxID=1432656 RepID=A0A0X1KIL0_9EURY|nr:hypothetical protein [Thermococcus guaymasensis]AJC71095.1 membrane protein [Thermococcus guaymasensis DSM 11113]